MPPIAEQLLSWRAWGVVVPGNFIIEISWGRRYFDMAVICPNKRFGVMWWLCRHVYHLFLVSHLADTRILKVLIALTLCARIKIEFYSDLVLCGERDPHPNLRVGNGQIVPNKLNKPTKRPTNSGFQYFDGRDSSSCCFSWTAFLRQF